MKTHKFICNVCGEVTECLVDAYPIGDRMLEGMDFVVKIKSNKVKIKFADEKVYKEYLKGLNVSYWEKEAHDYVKSCKNDVLGDCCKCKNEVFYDYK
jgi:hypothetical protein